MNTVKTDCSREASAGQAPGKDAASWASRMSRMSRTSRPRLCRQSSNTTGQRQRGVAAVEFALVFPVVFLMVYGMITFALILLAQQTLTLAVGEGARAALRYSANPVTAACAAVNSSTSWLGSNLVNCSSTSTTAPTVVTCPYQSSASCLQVTAIYPYASKPLVPTLPFLNLVLPNQIVASTIVQLEPVLATQ